MLSNQESKRDPFASNGRLITLGRWAIAAAVMLFGFHSRAEVITPKYWPQTDLAPYACTDTVSSFVNRVCYDAAKQHMLILLKATWYPYCGIDAETVRALLDAQSKGRYYNANIKGHFDCRNL